MSFRLGIRFRKNLANAPGFRVGLKHFGIAVFGDDQMRAATVIKNVYVVGSELRRFVESFGGFIGGALFEGDDAHPHPGGGVLGISGGFLAERGKGWIELIGAVLGDAEEEIR